MKYYSKCLFNGTSSVKWMGHSVSFLQNDTLQESRSDSEQFFGQPLGRERILIAVWKNNYQIADMNRPFRINIVSAVP